MVPFTLADIGHILSVSDAYDTNQTVQWFSSNTAVATIDRNTGVITPVSMGEATIRAERTIEDTHHVVDCKIVLSVVPLSGWELDYEPELWNYDAVQTKTNCYAYVLNNQLDPVNQDFGVDVEFEPTQQPGQFYNKNRGTEPEFSTTGYYSNPSLLVTAVEKDFEKYNEIFGTNLQFIALESKDATCPPGTYKVALVVGPADYHWYRQDSDGYWSHKQGTTEVRRTDSYTNGSIITDPQTAVRENYPIFVGYFALSPWNNLFDEADIESIGNAAINMVDSISTLSIQAIQIGMSLEEVVTMLGGYGEDIGSGTVIHQYFTNAGDTVTIVYNMDPDGVFRVQKIQTGGTSHEAQ